MADRKVLGQLQRHDHVEAAETITIYWLADW
jgi:hypothetical protein